MGTLIYTTNISLDGFINDAHGSIEFSEPSDEFLAHITERERGVGLYLYGRRLYDVMSVWETPTPEMQESATMSGYQKVWRAARKIVYSSSLDAVGTDNTTIERVFDPELVADLVGRSDSDVSVGGAHLAAHALRAGLVGELRFYIHPAIVGDGTPALPVGFTEKLELLDERRFDNGVVHVRYAVGA